MVSCTSASRLVLVERTRAVHEGSLLSRPSCNARFVLNLPQLFLWILKWRPGSHDCQQPVGLNGTRVTCDGETNLQITVALRLRPKSTFISATRKVPGCAGLTRTPIVCSGSP